MLNNRSFESLNEHERQELCKRPAIRTADILPVVHSIIDRVRSEGDHAVLDLTEKHDGVRPNPLLWPVRKADQIPVSPETRSAFEQACANLESFHRQQIPVNIKVETMPGVVCRREWRPIERVGLYVPGGTAPLPSTALMLGVPASLAGCSSKVLCTPPDASGKPPPEIELAAALTGISFIYLAGGAQAIAAMAYGTESIEKSDKIFGPGNQYVTAAKMTLQNSDARISIDLPAGPSEVMVVCDAFSNPDFVAADLLSQAEHGPDSQVALIAIGDVDTGRINSAIEKQLADLPRSSVAREALNNSFMVTTRTRDQAVEMINRYAPEHLIIQTQDPGELTVKVRHAGSVFIGPWTPESAGDYASGTNHTLPTYGYARMYSGVSFDSFITHITFQELTPAGLQGIAPTVIKMAEIEQLHAHQRAVTIRLDALKPD